MTSSRRDSETSGKPVLYCSALLVIFVFVLVFIFLFVVGLGSRERVPAEVSSWHLHDTVLYDSDFAQNSAREEPSLSSQRFVRELNCSDCNVPKQQQQQQQQRDPQRLCAIVVVIVVGIRTTRHMTARMAAPIRGFESWCIPLLLSAVRRSPSVYGTKYPLATSQQPALQQQQHRLVVCGEI